MARTAARQPTAPSAQRLRALLHKQESRRGLLIAFEGPDGAGKTTQRKLFKTWLEGEGHEVATSKWGSSPLLKPLIKARKMLCYATEGSLEILRGVGNGVAPHPADMWDAQLSLWIQESVVDALARINERTAAAIRQQNETPWVAQMPVKELISIRSGNGYLTTATEPRAPSEPTGDAPAKPPESFAEVFTHTVSNDLYDTVQFTVKMVVDARTLPAIVEEICKDNFHTLLRMSYEDVSTNQALFTMTDRIYGSHPTIRVVMDFETVFFGEPYRSLMPNDVRVALGLPEPQPQ